MALGRLTSFTFGNSFLTLVYANSQTYYVSYAHIIAGESDSRSGDLTIWIYTAGEVGETLSVKNSDLVAIGSSATAFLALFNQNIQPYSYWQDFLDSTTASGALPSEPSALRGQCLYARFRPIYNFGSASLINVPARFKAGTLYSQVPDTGAGDFTVTRATTPTAGRSTRINKDGLIELVADNVPRLDYPLGGAVNGCPALLVEPSAKNFWLQSENLSSASWLKLQAGSGIAPTVSASTESLFGLPTFEVTFTPNGTLSGDTSTIRQGFTPDATGNHTQSWYIRSLSGTQQLQAFFAGSVFQLTITETATRITATNNLTSILTWNSGLTQIGTHTRTNGKFLITAAQMEAGSVPTSYIPTTTAAVTRSADVISRTSASALIGQTEGTIYAEVDVRNWVNLSRIFSISDGTATNRIMTLFNTSNRFRVIVDSGGGAAQVDISSASLTNGIHKIAVGYAANDVVFYVNGGLVSGDTTVNIPACSQVFLGKIETSASSNFLNDRIRAVAIYPNRLTNTQLAALTAP